MSTEDLKNDGTTEQQPPQGQAPDTRPEPNDVEDRARAQGWVPKEEWTGDPAQWRDAAVYLDRGELLGKIKSQSAEMRELKGMITYVSEQNKRLYEAGYAKAIRDLEEQRDQAIENGDRVAVRNIDQQIDLHKQALRDTQQNTVAVTNPAEARRKAEERFNEFKTANPWYTQDEVMEDWANGAAVKFKAKNQNASDEDIYEYLSKEVRNKFPNKFKKVGAPSPDGKSNRSAGSPASKGGGSEFEDLLSSLSEDEAQIARNLVKRGHVTKEEFMENYSKVGGRR